MHARRLSAFTLIELLVVVAIIALLIAILLPSLGKAKTISMRTRCVSTLKGWGTATYTYMTEFNGYFGAKPTGGYYGSQWDQDPKAYGIPQGTGVTDTLNGATGTVGPAIYGDQMGNVAGPKARFCPADPATNMGQPGSFYYGNRPLAGYRYVVYMQPATGTTGPSGRPSGVQRVTQFKNSAEKAVMADGASANNYGDTFALITYNSTKAGPGGGTFFTGLNNNAAVGTPRNYNGQGWDTKTELENRHRGYGGVLFLDGHGEAVPYSDYLKHIPADDTDKDSSKTWTTFSN